MNETLARARARLMRAREEFLQRRGDHREAESELFGVREPDHVDAAQAEDTAIFHGPDDWVVARHGQDGRFTIVAKGDFPRARDGSWRLAGPPSR